MTNKQKNYYIEKYKNSKICSLYRAYKKPSALKESAYSKILLCRLSVDGYDIRIMSFNCQQFTCGFLFNCNGQRYLKVFTKSNTFDIKVLGE